MSDLTIGWILISFSLQLFATGVLLGKEKKDYVVSIAASFLLAQPFWWGLYFILKAFIDVH
jgi:hypothetical protein